MKALKIALILAAVILPSAFAQEKSANDFINDGYYKINKYALNTDYDVTNSVDRGSDYLRTSPLHPIITTVVTDDGSINVCSADNASQTVYVYEYSSDMKLKRTLRFNYEYDKFGAFAKDGEGNYYLFFARDLQESDKGNYSTTAIVKGGENMIVVKYNGKGEKIKSYIINSSDMPGDNDIKIPIKSRSCRMEISGDMLAVYFAKVKFMTPDSISHQESFGFILNKNALTPLQYQMPRVSHSFNQYVLPIEDGFIFGDKGDGNPRAFQFYRTLIDKRYTDSKYTYWNNTSWNSFRFKGEFGSNPTFAQFGGVAQTSKGYIFAGCSEKNNIRSDKKHNDARNLLLLTFYYDDSARINVISQPLWITNYPDKEQNAANPKIVSLGGWIYLIMWEYMTSKKYVETFMQLVDENGAAVSDEIKLAARLNVNDVARYDRESGNIYWAVNNGKREIVIYSLNVINAQKWINAKKKTNKNITETVAKEEVLAQKETAIVAPETVVEGKFTDSRDGQVYRTVKIGTQTWMAQNLNYAAPGSKCYRDYEGNCETYGRLYNWETAKKAVPAGWHLPTDEEWITLCRAVGGSKDEKINSADLYVEHKTAGAKLKAKTGWLEPYDDDDSFKATGTDEYGFSALPGGWGYLDGEFGDRYESEPHANVRRHGSWWSATDISSGHTVRWSMEYDNEKVERRYISVNKKDYRSVRCVKD